MEMDKNIKIDTEEKDIIINRQQIDDWKKQYGKIYNTVVGDVSVIWRILRRNEYVDIMVGATADEPDRRVFERQEQILKTVCLYPANIDVLIDQEGGLATGIAGEIMDKSGFGSTVTTEL